MSFDVLSVRVSDFLPLGVFLRDRVGVIDTALYPIPSYAIVGGLPIIQACIFHSAACAVFKMPLGTYFSHL